MLYGKSQLKPLLRKQKMKKTLLFVLVLLGIAQVANGQVVEDWVVELHEAHIYNDMPYRLMKPINYEPNKSYPVIVSLHGGGGRGSDNLKQLRNWNQVLAEEQNRKNYPCYILAPQANKLWNEVHLSNIKAIIKNLPSVDMSRIYILGHSMGGQGTYTFIQYDPEKCLSVLFVMREYLSVPAAVGFIALFGIAVQNGVFLVSYINQLRQQGVETKEAIVKGALQRLRPVLMTATTTVLGLMPLLLSKGIGSEVQRPLASVVVFGLTSATILTLFVIPAFYPWFAAKLDNEG